MANPTQPQPEGADPELVQLQRLLASYYKVERLLGRGRLTAVYKAEEINPPRPVAIKMLPPELGSGPAGARFKDEARKATALNHPNIVPLYRVGTRAGAPFFLAMKLVEGRNLAAVIEAQGALPLPAILVALRIVAETLSYAQGRGATHGRLHAANVLVDGTGHVMVSDFGIALALEDATPAAAGKSGASSPERTAGGAADPRSDQYALGVVALQLLTGSLLPLADPLVSSRNIGAARDGVPDALLQIVQTVLAQDPAQRYATAADLLAALKAIPFSEADRHEGYAVLGQLARGEAVPKVPVPAPPRRFEARTVTRPVAPRASTAATTAPAASPAPAPPAALVVEAVGAAQAAPPVAVPPAPPAPPRVSAAAPAPPRVSAATPAPPIPAPPAVEHVSAGPALRARPSQHIVPARPAPRRRSRVVWVLATLLVAAGLAGAAYWLLVLRPAASRMAQAPVASQAPSAPAPSAAGPAVAESARADTAHPGSAAAATVRPGTAPSSSPTGELSLAVDPTTARIQVDGKVIGREGVADTAVAAGRRRLRITAPGYPTFDTVVVVAAGDVLDLGQISLEQSAGEAAAPAPTAMGRLRLRAVPPSAEIFVDGQSVGVGALVDFEVAAGERQLRISAPGYVTLDTLITVSAGATVRLGQLSLKNATGGP